ncbi:MAG: hypothetical protein ABJN69_07845 [Hellea sp.]
MNQPYDKYIPIIFDNNGDLGSGQYFEDDIDSLRDKVEIELEEEPTLLIDILHSAFTNFETHLSSYTVYQLSNAIDYIFNPGLSNYGFVFKDDTVDRRKRIEALDSLSDLMLFIYEDTAEPILGHLSQSVQDKRKDILNGVCYMFWDTATIPYNCDEDIRNACLAVMGRCARSNNIAVVEGALHGLGHAQRYSDKKLIEKYIDEANLGTSENSEALRRYAQAAKRGRVL